MSESIATAATPHPWLPVVSDGAGRSWVLRDRRFESLSSAVVGARRRLTGAGDRSPTSTDAADLDLLRRHGMVVDQPSGAVVASGSQRRTWLSRTAMAPSPARSSRTAEPPAVRLVGPAAFTDPVSVMLQSCGIPVASRRTPTPVGELLVIAFGRPSLAQIHDWMITATPHVVVVPRAASIRVGPLVLPGDTACLHCLERARADAWGAWPRISEQLRATRIPEPAPQLVWLAGAWLVDQVERLQDREACRLLGRYRTFALDADDPIEHRVARHPRCGCWWPVLRESPSPGDATVAATSTPARAGSQ